VYRCLSSLRSQLADEFAAHANCTGSLERFELAWRAYEAGNTHEALQLFGEVIADRELAGAGAADPRAREAFVRAAEILGRHAELAGDIRSAAQLYRRILELDGNGNGNVARRLLLMLWRQARIQEAAELAPRVLLSDGNLAQHLRGSDAVNDLARRLGREAGREATPATDGREVGLPDRCAARAPDDLAQAFAEMRLSASPAPLRS
jgi:tetratricopeptide (TPR) repeat protein